jgi:hypothetical protein
MNASDIILRHKSEMGYVGIRPDACIKNPLAICHTECIVCFFSSTAFNSALNTSDWT